MRAIVLAAGKGRRLKISEEDKPKVLQCISGKPLIRYILDALEESSVISEIVIVIGYKKEMVMDYCGDRYIYAFQEEQRGTGHAVMCAEKAFADYDGDVLIAYGDMPLFTAQTIRLFSEYHTSMHAECTFMTAVFDNPPAYGRVVRDIQDRIVDIIEDADCNSLQKAIKEVNAGMYILKSKVLFELLSYLRVDNVQSEYYLTEIPIIALKRDFSVGAYTLCDTNEALGVNTIDDLEKCSSILAARQCKGEGYE